MKYFVFFQLFLCIFSGNAQSDSIVIPKKSVISLDKVKTVYRGIVNPISIAVTDCKSYEVSGIGLKEVSKGKYTLSPGSGNEVKVIVKITNFDDSILVEEHIFKIRNITNAVTALDGSHCQNCTLLFEKEKIKDAYISVHFRDFKFDYEAEVVEFTIKISKEQGIIVYGNRITEEVYKLLKKNQVVAIYDIKTKFQGLGNTLVCRIPPIIFKVDK